MPRLRRTLPLDGGWWVCPFPRLQPCSRSVVCPLSSPPPLVARSTWSLTTPTASARAPRRWASSRGTTRRAYAASAACVGARSRSLDRGGSDPLVAAPLFCPAASSDLPHTHTHTHRVVASRHRARAGRLTTGPRAWRRARRRRRQGRRAPLHGAGALLPRAADRRERLLRARLAASAAPSHAAPLWDLGRTPHHTRRRSIGAPPLLDGRIRWPSEPVGGLCPRQPVPQARSRVLAVSRPRLLWGDAHRPPIHPSSSPSVSLPAGTGCPSTSAC